MHTSCPPFNKNSQGILKGKVQSEKPKQALEPDSDMAIKLEFSDHEHFKSMNNTSRVLMEKADSRCIT